MSVKILSGRYANHGPPPGFDDILHELPMKIAGAGCHGKFIFMIFENGWTAWNTLGMSGTWSRSLGRHSRIKLLLEDGPVFFNDVRNFGTLKFIKGKDFLIDKLNSLGPDMLNEDVENDLFLSRIRMCKRKTVAQAIMDQSVIAGVGNYLKAEALYISKISPHRPCESLSDQEVVILNESIKKTIRSSYETGGATISTYTGFEGEIGEYSQRFLVYNQKTDPHGNVVIKEKTKDGRTTHWVPEIQR